MTELSDTLDVEGLLDSHLMHDSGASWYRAPDIPAAKLAKAIGKYADGISAASVLALGDGTVFGSAKEGVLITEDKLVCRTSEGRFSIQLAEVVSAKKLGGWPGYNTELSCRDGSTHVISMTCFEKKQEGFVNFLNALAIGNNASIGIQEPPPEVQEPVPLRSGIRQLAPSRECESAVVSRWCAEDTTRRHVNAGMTHIGVCQHDEFENVDALFTAAFETNDEWPLLKGYCQYVGFNGRQVDALFLVTNQRLLLFSMELGVKIFCVEMTKRLLGKLPVPFIDTLVGLLLFTIPRSIYVALRGGKNKLIAQALANENGQLLSTNPPLRKVKEHNFSQIEQAVAQVEVGMGVCTGMLDRKFGITFASKAIVKSFSAPQDMILPGYETPEPFERLLCAARTTLTKFGCDYRLDATGQKLILYPTVDRQKKVA